MCKSSKMHADEIDISIALVKRFLKEQFPKWADLQLRLMQPAGTDNVMIKLGSDKVLRLPRTKGSLLSLEKEKLWLPKLAPHLPIPIPEIIGEGVSGSDYPLPWLVCKYLEGENPIAENRIDYQQAAIDLGHFVVAMQKIDSADGPKCRRGQPLINRNKETQNGIALMADIYDADFLTRIWESALSAPAWPGDPVWIHGDLHAGNLLAQTGKITAVVDFGLTGAGDPASDLMVAWTLLTKETRETFRSIVKPDEATWARARGWALTLGVVAYPYYHKSNPVFSRIAKRAIDEVIADSK